MTRPDIGTVARELGRKLAQEASVAYGWSEEFAIDERAGLQQWPRLEHPLPEKSELCIGVYAPVELPYDFLCQEMEGYPAFYYLRDDVIRSNP